MGYILGILLICFFIIMIIFMVVAILQGIFYIIYQRSLRLHLSIHTYGYIEGFALALEYKGEEVDTIIMHSKHKGYYYMIGLKGVYKIGRGKWSIIDECDENLRDDEKSLIDEMKIECKNRINKYKDLLKAFSQQYNINF